MKNILKFYPLVCLTSGLIILSAGIYLISTGERVIELSCRIGGGVGILHGVVLGVAVITKLKLLTKDSVKSLVINALLNICFGGMIMLLPHISFAPIYFVFVIYILLNAAIKLVDYLICVRNNVSGRIKELFFFVFFLVFGMIMIFVPEMDKNGFLTASGIYSIIYGGFLVWDFIFQCLSENLRERIKRKLNMPPPALVSLFHPFTRLKSRKRLDILIPERTKTELIPYFPEGKQTDIPPDMEVLIHVSEYGTGILGHCDICFDGCVYSYGSYDLTRSFLFGGIGDGTLVIGKCEPYIKFYVSASPREIYGYGFRLGETQKSAVRDEIVKLVDMAYPWEPPLYKISKSDPKASGEAALDWGSRVWNCTGADFYKFKSGKLKTYFVATSNCVMMADDIVRKACKDIMPHRHTLSPGAYYDYLEHLLSMVGSPVFCRTLYNRVTTSAWSYTPRIAYLNPQSEVITETQANKKAMNS